MRTTFGRLYLCMVPDSRPWKHTKKQCFMFIFNLFNFIARFKVYNKDMNIPLSWSYLLLLYSKYNHELPETEEIVC